MLKIWGRTNSINVQKVLWCCGELNIPYERVDAGLQFGVNTTPEYKATPSRWATSRVGTSVQRWFNLPVERENLQNLAAYYQRLQARAPFKQHVDLPLN